MLVNWVVGNRQWTGCLILCC